jgi:hypothetical protein
MTPIFVLMLFGTAIGIDYLRRAQLPRPQPLESTTFVTPGFEWIGAVAQDGGELIDDTFLGEGI